MKPWGYLLVIGAIAGLVATPFVLVLNAQTRAVTAEKNAETAAGQANRANAEKAITKAAFDAAEKTHTRTRAVNRAVAETERAIANAVVAEDLDALYAAWGAGSERVWRDAGFARTRAPDDPGAGGASGTAPAFAAAVA